MPRPYVRRSPASVKPQLPHVRPVSPCDTFLGGVGMTVWSEGEEPLSNLGGAAQRSLGHGSMLTGCVLYAVNGFFAGVPGVADCTVSSTL
jgi:hypothetical protein